MSITVSQSKHELTEDKSATETPRHRDSLCLCGLFSLCSPLPPRLNLLPIPRSCLLELLRDILSEQVGRQHPRKRAKAENPALERPIDAHVERHDEPA